MLRSLILQSFNQPSICRQVSDRCMFFIRWKERGHVTCEVADIIGNELQE